MKRSRIRCPWASAQRAVASRTPSWVSRTGARARAQRRDEPLGRCQQAVELGVERRPALPQRLELVARVVPALELARVAAPALLADAAGRVEHRERLAHARLHLLAPLGKRSARSPPARATVAHARPQHRREHRQRPDLRRRAAAPRRRPLGHLQQVADGVLHPADTGAVRPATPIAMPLSTSAALRCSSASGSPRWMPSALLEHAHPRARARARPRTASSCRPGRRAARAASRRARCRWRAGRRSPARLSSTGARAITSVSITSRSGQRDCDRALDAVDAAAPTGRRRTR